jgi:hypothetical protein
MALFRRLGRGAVRRRTPLPEAGRDLLGLERGSAVLAWSTLVGGGWVAATPAGVRALLPTGAVVERPWTDVDHVAWDQDSGMLAVWWVGSRLPTALELEEGSFLPEVVHERVRSSLVLARDVPVPGGRTVCVALRKADDGTLSTQVVPARGVRLGDPEVAALVAQAQAALRDEAGMGPEGGPVGGPAGRLGPL